MATFNGQVAASADDATERADDTNFASNAVTNIIRSNSSAGARNHVAFKIPNVTIPAGATINSCTASVYVFVDTQDDPNLDIFCEAVDDAADFATNADIVNRSKTSASAAWVATGVGVGAKTTPDFTAVLQEVIDRAGWASGQDIVVFLWARSDTDARLAIRMQDNGTGDGPSIAVDYTEAAAGAEIGLVTEADSALGLSGLKVGALGLASEGESALGLTAVKSKVLGLVSESDSALGVTAAAGGATTILQDTFTDSDSTAIGSHAPDINTPGNSWADIVGTCLIQSNKAVADDSANIVGIDIGLDGGFTISIEYTPVDTLSTHGGIIVRGDGSSNTYFFVGNDNGGSNFVIAWRDGSPPTNIDSVAFSWAVGTTYTIELTLSAANEFTATIDGGNTLSATSSQLAGNVLVGFKGRSGATFDNLSVTTPGGGGAVEIGLVSETDSALAMTGAKVKALGLTAETDAALAMGGLKSAEVGLAAETEVALPMTAVKRRVLGLVVETDVALPVSAAGSLVIGLVTETDVALPMTAVKRRVLGLVSESDQALPVGGAKAATLGLVSSTELALGLVGLKVRPIGLVTELDSALGLSGLKVGALGLVSEVDVALAVLLGNLVVGSVVVVTDAAVYLVGVSDAAVFDVDVSNDALFDVIISDAER